MITGENLLIVSILLPVIAALLCLLLRQYTSRNIVAFITGIALAATSIAMLFIGTFDYQPAEIAGISWDMVITAADYALMAIILFIGLKQRHLLITVLAAAQVGLLTYFDFVLGGVQVKVEPAFAIDNLSIIMALIINIVGLVDMYLRGQIHRRT